MQIRKYSEKHAKYQIIPRYCCKCTKCIRTFENWIQDAKYEKSILYLRHSYRLHIFERLSSPAYCATQREFIYIYVKGGGNLTRSEIEKELKEGESTQ